MPQRAPTRAQSPPSDLISDFSQGYNGYTNPFLLKPSAWAPGTQNVFNGQFMQPQRARFATVKSFSPATGLPFSSLKYFATPTTSAYLLADIGSASAKMFAYDTNAAYAQTQRLNPYFDPTGAGIPALAGPWSREAITNIIYEMNGQIKQSGRGLNAATVEGWGLDSPDASPQVVISAGSSQTITNIQRSNGVVTVNLGGALTVPGGNGIGFINVIITAGDTSFAGTFIVVTGSGTATLTWSQPGQNTVLLTPTGTVDVNITKSIGRSYSYAWENANKNHIGAPSPATQFIKYTAQNGQIQLIEPGTVTFTNASTIVTGTGTFFTSAWVGRSMWAPGVGVLPRIVSVQSPTQMTLAAIPAFGNTNVQFQIYDPQATHVRLYETGDGQATYFRVQRNVFVPGGNTIGAAGLLFFDNGNSEPPNFPFTTETSQLNNVPPPIGTFVNEYQSRLLVYGVPGAPQTFFYSNQESTNVGLAQESFAPLNQVTLPIPNGKINGQLEFPGSLIIWSDKQDMFRLTGLLSDNVISSTAAQQGASVARLPYNLGCASPYACDITPLGGIWLTPNAEVWLYTDRYAPRNIGRPVQDLLSNIPTASLSLARARYYHTDNRNWFVLAVPALSNFNTTLLILDLDVLASNGSPSYFTFDMATNQPAWYVYQVRSDFVETVIESGGLVRMLVSSIDTITDVDFQGVGVGSEISVSATLITHPWGNDSAQMIKRPTFTRFRTNFDSNQIGPQGWTFQVWGIDDDFYDLDSPLILNLYPGPVNPNLPANATLNDTSSLGGNPDLNSGAPFRHSPELFRIGGVNFVAGRRLKFVINYPTTTGQNFQFRQIQLGYGANPPN